MGCFTPIPEKGLAKVYQRIQLIIIDFITCDTSYSIFELGQLVNIYYLILSKDQTIYCYSLRKKT